MFSVWDISVRFAICKTLESALKEARLILKSEGYGSCKSVQIMRGIRRCCLEQKPLFILKKEEKND